MPLPRDESDPRARCAPLCRVIGIHAGGRFIVLLGGGHHRRLMRRITGIVGIHSG